MNNTHNLERPSQGIKLFRRKDGSVGMIHDPIGCISIDGVEEVVELDATPEEVAELRQRFREDKLDFARVKRDLAKGRGKDTAKLVDTIEE